MGLGISIGVMGIGKRAEARTNALRERERAVPCAALDDLPRTASSPLFTHANAYPAQNLA